MCKPIAVDGLRELLARKGITVKELATNVGVARQSVFAWAHGRPSPRFERRAAGFLGVRISTLRAAIAHREDAP